MEKYGRAGFGLPEIEGSSAADTFGGTHGIWAQNQVWLVVDRPAAVTRVRPVRVPDLDHLRAEVGEETTRGPAINAPASSTHTPDRARTVCGLGHGRRRACVMTSSMPVVASDPVRDAH
ncbi:hypothetical protein CBI38_32000 (plasmid) [Rhodococcus oxybenzonivorans]|uniref:Uncharacterized protein n=1 Tax=Rhodococcus oxybenzonivorans TaxID=1990687 RepID=A0A2S2C5M4_9NOCA|nr:hypothetical protein CBI38_32000 [Rhodococcus oxybenzonivorans]